MQNTEISNNAGQKKKLNFIGVASMYVGVIMGAGFASGRECWQYYGVFGDKGLHGVLLSSIAFIVIGVMLSYIAINKNTEDLGELVSCFDNPLIKKILGILIAAVYYSMIVAMTAAGGSLLNQQFGLSKLIGGAIIAVLVILTVIGGFERVSGIFHYLIPILFIFGIITISMVIFSNIHGNTEGVKFEPGGMTPNWWTSGIIFVSYNTLGMITMSGASAINAKTNKQAYIGAILGTILLSFLTLILLIALQKDMVFSASLDLPMLGYSARLSPLLNTCYAIVLYGAVYSTAASTYYGFSTKIPEGKYKRAILIAGVIVGFILGLTGFKAIVEYLYSVQGYLGVVIILMIVINFVRTIVNKKSH